MWQVAKSAAWAEYGRRHYRGIVMLGTFGRLLPAFGVIVALAVAVLAVRWGVTHLHWPASTPATSAPTPAAPVGVSHGAPVHVSRAWIAAGVAVVLAVPGALALRRGWSRWIVGAGASTALGGIVLLCGALALAAYALIGVLA